MRGGFLPVPAALSVTVLLFVTSALVNESYVRGEYLLPAAGAFEVWVPGLRCRWTSVEDNAWATEWGARLHRTGAGDLGRYHEDEMNLLSGHLSTAFSGFWEHTRNLLHGKRDHTINGTCFLGVKSLGVTPVDFPSTDIIWANGTAKDIPNIVHPLNEPARHCFYQCIGYKPWSLPTFITQLGTISVGAAIVVTITDKISAWVGPELIMRGMPYDNLKKVFDRTKQTEFSKKHARSCFSHSKTFVALLLLSIYYFLKSIVVGKIDADGIYTVDYYVTFVMLLSSVVVMVLRFYHPYRLTTQSFTKKMWSEGVDAFLMTEEVEKILNKHSGREEIDSWADGITKINDKLKRIELDLTQWMHLVPVQRNALLLNYARRPAKHMKATDKQTFGVVGPVKALAQDKGGGIWHPLNDGGPKLVDVTQSMQFTMESWKDDHTVILEPVEGNPLFGKVHGIELQSFHLVDNTPDLKWEELLADTPYGVGAREPLLNGTGDVVGKV